MVAASAAASSAAAAATAAVAATAAAAVVCHHGPGMEQTYYYVTGEARWLEENERRKQSHRSLSLQMGVEFFDAGRCPPPAAVPAAAHSDLSAA